jgi:hypothetical protein
MNQKIQMTGAAGMPLWANNDCLEVAARVAVMHHEVRSRQFIAALPVTNSSAVLLQGESRLVCDAQVVPKPPESIKRTEHQSPDTSGPPWVAECIFVLCTTARYRESAQGCLNERFERDCRQYGRARAVLFVSDGGSALDLTLASPPVQASAHAGGAASQPPASPRSAWR